MPDLDDTFRCTHFACTLAVKHCLRRQTEVKTTATRVAKGDRDGERVETSKPLHPFCASGDCPEGNAHRAEHPEFVPVRTDPRAAPRLDLIAEETDMPKGKRTKPWPCCGSKGTRHLSTCTGESQAKAPKVELVLAAPDPVQPDLATYPVDALLELRDLVAAELLAREKMLRQQLAMVRGEIRPERGDLEERQAAGGEA